MDISDENKIAFEWIENNHIWRVLRYLFCLLVIQCCIFHKYYFKYLVVLNIFYTINAGNMYTFHIHIYVL